MKRILKRVVSALLGGTLLIGAVPVGAASGRLASPTVITVGKGSDYDYNTISEALSSVNYTPTESSAVTISIDKGVYEESFEVNIPYVKLVNSGNAEDVVITYDKANNHVDSAKSFGTDKTATVIVGAKAVGFTAENITFQNSYNIDNDRAQTQAVALETVADKVTIKNCRLIGRQDTLYLKGASKGQSVYGSANSARVYLKDTYIEGTVDFIFGDATAYFDNCTINMVNNNNGGHFTAPNTTLFNLGYVFNKCTLTVDSAYTSDKAEKIDLGRPWQCDKDYPNSGSSSVYINCKLPDILKTEGFSVWDDNTVTDKIRFYEYGSTDSKGTKRDLSKRASFVKVLTDEQAEGYSAYNVLRGQDGWNPANDKGKAVDCDITLNSYSVSVPVGETYALKALALPSVTSANITYSSENEAVAKVDSNGVITGLSVGKTYVYAKLANGLTAKTAVEVTAMRTEIPKLVSLSVDSDSNIVVGKTLTANYRYELESDNNIDDAVISWYAVKDGNPIIIKSGKGSFFKTYEVESKDVGCNIKVEVSPATTTTYGETGNIVSYTTQSVVTSTSSDSEVLLRTNFTDGTKGFDTTGTWNKIHNGTFGSLTAGSTTEQPAFMAYSTGYDWKDINVEGRFRFNPTEKGFSTDGSFDFYTNYSKDGQSYYKVHLDRGSNTKSIRVYIYKKADGGAEELLASDETSLKNNIPQNAGENNPYFNIKVSSVNGKVTMSLTLSGEKKSLITLSGEDKSPLGNGTFAMGANGAANVLLINTISVESTIDKVNSTDKQRIFLLGDSTVKHYGDDNTIGGWGEYLVNYFDDDVTIINKAEGGRSTRSFINQGRLDEVVKELREGDYVFIQFGTNDQRTDDSAFLQHSVALGTPNAEGIYPSTQAVKCKTPQWLYDACKDTEYPYGETFYPYESGTFKWYLGQYIRAVRSAGATPVLITPACRIFFDSDGKIVSHFGENDGYVLSALQLAQEENCQYIDMFNLTKSLYESYGVLTTQGLHNIKEDGTVDLTHYNKFGANLVASKLADVIKDMNIEGVSDHVQASVKYVAKTDSLKTANLFMIGGSGMAADTEGDYAVENGGYGDYLQDYLSDKVTVRNLAIPDATAKSYIKSDNYQTFIDSLQAGDYVMIGFGIDDAVKQTPEDSLERYSSADGDLNTRGSFAWYLYNYYVKPITDKKAVAIMLTPYSLRNEVDGELVFESSPYTKAVTDLVVSKQLFFVNLENSTKDMYTTMGAEGSKVLNAYSREDGICSDEFSKFGARLVAKRILTDCKQSSASLKDYIDDSKLTATEPMQRADFVYMVMNVMNYKEEAYNNFADVTKGKYYENAVAVAKNRKLVDTNAKNLFFPEEQLTEELLVKVISRSLASVGSTADMSSVYALTKGTISNEIGIWAVDKLYEAIN